jgi:hypothetical protein
MTDKHPIRDLTSAVLSDSFLLPKRSRSNLDTCNKFNYHKFLFFRDSLVFHTFENIETKTSLGTVLMTIEIRDKIAARLSSFSAVSRVVNKTARYSVEVSSPP